MTPLADRLGLGRRELVSLVGGGGKSSLLFALGNELATTGRRVILTTTTKMGWDQAMAAPTICWSADTACAVAALERSGPVMLLTAGDGHKVTGPPPGVVDHLFAETNVDFVIVEADGSKGRPLKAPAAFEPVVPDTTTTVVILMGVDAVGAPLEHAAHRVEQATAFTGQGPDHVLTADDCVRIITHPRGTLRSIPEGARVIVGLTRVGDGDKAVVAVLRRLLCAHPHISDVVVIPRPRDGSTPS